MPAAGPPRLAEPVLRFLRVHTIKSPLSQKSPDRFRHETQDFPSDSGPDFKNLYSQPGDAGCARIFPAGQGDFPRPAAILTDCKGTPRMTGKRPLRQRSMVMNTDSKTRRSLPKTSGTEPVCLKPGICRFPGSGKAAVRISPCAGCEVCRGVQKKRLLLSTAPALNGFMRVGFYHLRKEKIQHKQKAAAPPWRRLPPGCLGPPTNRRPWASGGGPERGKRPRRQKPPGSSEVFHRISWDAQSRLLKILKITS